MPCQYVILPNKRVVSARYAGVVTLPDVRTLLRETRNHPEYDTGFRSYHDLSQATSYDLRFREMMEITDRIKRRLKVETDKIVSAIFAPDDLSYGMARMFYGLASDDRRIEIAIFREREEIVDHFGFDPAISRAVQVPSRAPLNGAGILKDGR